MKKFKVGQLLPRAPPWQWVPFTNKNQETRKIRRLNNMNYIDDFSSYETDLVRAHHALLLANRRLVELAMENTNAYFVQRHVITADQKVTYLLDRLREVPPAYTDADCPPEAIDSYPPDGAWDCLD